MLCVRMDEIYSFSFFFPFYADFRVTISAFLHVPFGLSEINNLHLYASSSFPFVFSRASYTMTVMAFFLGGGVDNLYGLCF